MLGWCRLLLLLTRLCNARLAVEVGTYTGCSALHIAEGLAEGGRLVTCDIDPEVTAIARRYWAESPHGHKIELRLGRAQQTLQDIEGPIDLVFLDADKESYPEYWELLVPKVRPGGLLVVDNTLWSGRVLAPDHPTDHGIVALNRRIAEDTRVQHVMLSVRDGITVAQVVA